MSRDAYGREVDDEDPFLGLDYASLLRPGVTGQQRTQTLRTSPISAASPSMTSPAPPGTAPPSMTGSPQVSAPNQRAPVAGSRFVDYSYLFGLNAGKAQESARRMAARAQASAAEAEARLKGAQAAYAERVKAGSGTDYEGQDFARPNPGEDRIIAPMADAWREPYDTSRSQTLGTSRQGLTGTPQRGPIAPEKIAALAAQTYGGPNELTELPGYDELASSALTAQNRTGALASQEGLQALLMEDNPNHGGYAVSPESVSGKSRWDAAMLGSAGGDNFRELAKRYGGLVKGVEQANVASRAQADAARARTLAEGVEWKGLQGKSDAWAAEESKRKEGLAGEAAIEAQRRGKKSYDDFMALSVPEALRRGHKATDIAGGAIGLATGGTFSPLNFVTNAFDSVLGQPGASSGERAKKVFTDAEHYGVDSRAVYNSMTPEEVAEVLSYDDDRKTVDFIEKRWNQLRAGRKERGVR